MPTCNNCQQETAIPHVYCLKCLNNWLIMREIVNKKLLTKYGEVTRQNFPIYNQEIRRLNNLWKRNRDEFEREIAKWL